MRSGQHIASTGNPPKADPPAPAARTPRPPQRLFSLRERAAHVLLGALVMLAAGGMALRSELSESERDFHREAHTISVQVARRLAEAETLIGAIHGLHRSLDDFQDTRFPSIVRRFVANHPEVRWMAYAEPVDAGDEATFHARMREAGFDGLRIGGPDDNIQEAQPLAFRLPIHRVEPMAPEHESLLGTDLMARPKWRTMVLDAVESGEVRGTAVDEPAVGLKGLLLTRAVYHGRAEPESAWSRRRRLAGLLMLFVDGELLLHGLQTTLEGVSITLLDDGRRAGATPLASAVPGAGTATARLLPVHRGSIPIGVGGVHVPLDVHGPVRPHLAVVVLSMTLAGLLCLSLLQGLRLKRRARIEERSAMAQARLAQVTLHSIGEAVVRLDGTGRLRYMNPVAEEMSGVPAAHAGGRLLEEVFDLERGGRITAATVDRVNESHSSVTLTSSGGVRRAVACTLSPVDDAQGNASGQVLVMRDVSREDELSRELSYQASHDPLTELPNRREFERRLDGAIHSARNKGRVHSVCYVDLDQFKLVNDTCGHAEGDRMLRQIAGVLATEVRAGDTLARLGGDEFGVLLDECDVERAIVIAERFCRAVADFRFISDGRAFELGASIGVVAIDANSGTADDVKRAADLACYAAKDTGRNRVHLFRREDRVISRNHREMHWHVKIQEALETDRFALHGQPILPLHRGASVSGMHELLLRMVDRDGNLVPPMAFLPAAERYGLMKTLDRTVVERAFEHAASVPGDGGLYNINLSGQSLTDATLEPFIHDCAARTGVLPSRICFEVTETSAISNLALASQLMQQLRRVGFRFALDDFGAGLSSFAYLKQLPVDFIKIDGQFVRDIRNDPVARAMVTSIISVARVLKIETVAEKVEDTETRRCLRELGVDYVQGFHIARPRPVLSGTQLARIA